MRWFGWAVGGRCGASQVARKGGVTERRAAGARDSDTGTAQRTTHHANFRPASPSADSQPPPSPAKHICAVNQPPRRTALVAPGRRSCLDGSALQKVSFQPAGCSQHPNTTSDVKAVKYEQARAGRLRHDSPPRCERAVKRPYIAWTGRSIMQRTRKRCDATAADRPPPQTAPQPQGR